MRLIERNIPPSGLHLIVEITLNGEEHFLVLDTGASKTIFDLAFYKMYFNEDDIVRNEEASFTVEGEISKSYIAPVEDIIIDQIAMTDKEIVLINLEEINMVYSELGYHPVVGILGSDWLKEYNAIIDYEKMQITLSNNSE